MTKQELLEDAVSFALRDAESRLYMLPASDDYQTSCQKDILSAQIGRYRTALGLNQPVLPDDDLPCVSQACSYKNCGHCPDVEGNCCDCSCHLNIK